jgi:hypothetical protein
MLTRFSGATAPISWASSPVRHGKDDDIDVVCPKDDVEGKPAKDRPAEIGIEDWKCIRRDGNQVNQPIQFIQKPNCCPDTSLRVPSGGFVGVPPRCRMEADGSSH